MVLWVCIVLFIFGRPPDPESYLSNAQTTYMWVGGKLRQHFHRGVVGASLRVRQVPSERPNHLQVDRGELSETFPRGVVGVSLRVRPVRSKRSNHLQVDRGEAIASFPRVRPVPSKCPKHLQGDRGDTIANFSQWYCGRVPESEASL